MPPPSSALPCLSQFPRPISPYFPTDFCGFPYRLSFNEPLLLLFLRGFLAFSLLRHHWPPSKVKEGKHEARPYCDGLFNRRNEPRRIEFLRLSTRGASGPKKNLRSIYRDHRKKYFRRITHNQESSKSYLIVLKRAA